MSKKHIITCKKCGIEIEVAWHVKVAYCYQHKLERLEIRAKYKRRHLIRNA